MWLVRTRFRRTTAAGRKAAARAALHAKFLQAAVTIQKYVRRHLAKKKVGTLLLQLCVSRNIGDAHPAYLLQLECMLLIT